MSDDLAVKQQDEEATYWAIGRFIVAFADLESMLRLYLQMRIKLDWRYSEAIMTHDFALLCTAAISVFSHVLREQDRKALGRLISERRALNDDRVKVVHGSWDMRPGGNVRHVSRQTLSGQYWGPMAKYLETRASFAKDLNWKLQVLLLKVRHDFKDKHGRWIKFEFDNSKIMELAAYHEERKVGAYILHDDNAGRVYADYVHVEQDYRRAGIARELLQYASDDLQEIHLSKRMEVLESEPGRLTAEGRGLVEIALEKGWLKPFPD